MNYKFTQSLKIASIVVVFVIGSSYALAGMWSELNTPAPNPNAITPLNVGTSAASSQSANGTINVTTGLQANSSYGKFIKVGGITSVGAVGTFKYVDGNQGVGKVLVSDASGIAHWVATSTLGLPTVGSTGGGTGGGNGGGSSGGVVYAPGGSCVWGDRVYGHGQSCVDLQQHVGVWGGGKNGDYVGTQYYWDYYTCYASYWFFDSQKTLYPGRDGGYPGPYSPQTGNPPTPRCSDGSSVVGTLQSI